MRANLNLINSAEKITHIRGKRKNDDRNYIKINTIDFTSKEEKKKIRIFATCIIYTRKTRIVEYLIKEKGSSTRVQLTATLLIITLLQ